MDNQHSQLDRITGITPNTAHESSSRRVRCLGTSRCGLFQGPGGVALSIHRDRYHFGGGVAVSIVEWSEGPGVEKINSLTRPV